MRPRGVERREHSSITQGPVGSHHQGPPRRWRSQTWAPISMLGIGVLAEEWAHELTLPPALRNPRLTQHLVSVRALRRREAASVPVFPVLGGHPAHAPAFRRRSAKPGEIPRRCVPPGRIVVCVPTATLGSSSSNRQRTTRPRPSPPAARSSSVCFLRGCDASSAPGRRRWRNWRAQRPKLNIRMSFAMLFLRADIS